jgi:hypothetical protein
LNILLLDIEDLDINNELGEAKLKNNSIETIFGEDVDPEKTVVVINKIDSLKKQLKKSSRNIKLILKDHSLTVATMISVKQDVAINDLINFGSSRV